MTISEPLRAGPPGCAGELIRGMRGRKIHAEKVNRLQTVGLTCHTVYDRHYDRFKICEDGRFGSESCHFCFGKRDFQDLMCCFLRGERRHVLCKNENRYKCKISYTEYIYLYKNHTMYYNNNHAPNVSIGTNFCHDFQL